MYRGFKLDFELSDFEGLSKNSSSLRNYIYNNTNHERYYRIGKTMFDEFDQEVGPELVQYIIGDSGVIDGTKLQEDWFPTVNCDIFISHSHKDEDLAITLAGWLYETFG